MSIGGYLAENWGLLIVVTGMSIILLADVHLKRRMVQLMGLTGGMLVVYSAADYIETYLSEQETYCIWRGILSAFKYSLLPFLLFCIVLIMFPMQKRWLMVPSLINAVLCFVSLKTGIVFDYTYDNYFVRGSLGYLTYFISALYLAYLYFRLFRDKTYDMSEFRLLLFVSLTSLCCLLLPLFVAEQAVHWFTVTIAIDLLMYYVYMLMQLTKHDALTKLLNRQSYYADSEKYEDDITAIVAMDMNGLKKTNDKYGHAEGDKALKALADCFVKAAYRKQRIYRIGGDEYVILCLDQKEEDVRELVDRIRAELAKIPYGCSVGYAMREKGMSIDRLYHRADDDLYTEKRQYYIESGDLEEG